MKKYDYRLVQPRKESKHSAGYFIVYEVVNEGDPLAKAWCREAAELIVQALNVQYAS